MPTPSDPEPNTAGDDPTRVVAKTKGKDGSQPPKIGRFFLTKKLGQGGMGAVYLAEDKENGREVALKVLPRDKAENPTLVRRFKAEAQAVAHLKHENIISIYEAGEASGYLYIALEFVDGTDIAKYMNHNKKPLSVKRSISVMKQVASALQHASEHKIVHRDIKPGNLMIRKDGTVKLADMGLARIVDEGADASITRTGTTVGTVDYMSPEQARDSKSADVRSDIYSLGCTWYYLLTGGPPFPEGGITNKLHAHFRNPFPDPRQKNKDVPEPVIAVMRRMTEKDPAKRYQTASELLAELIAIEKGGDRVSDAILDEPKKVVKVIPQPDTSEGIEEETETELQSSRRKRKISAAEMPTVVPKPAAGERSGGLSEMMQRGLFYVTAFVVAACVLGGIIWLAGQMNRAVDGEGENLGQQLATNATNDSSRKVSGNSSKTTIEGDKSATGSEKTDRTIGDAVEDVNNYVNSLNKSVETSDPKVRVGGADDEEFFDVRKPGEKTKKGPKREKTEVAALPSWVRDVGTPVAKQMVVNPNSTNPKEYASLNQALRDVPKDGARILLNGSGPFPLKVEHIRDCSRIIIEAAVEDAHPLIVFLEPEREAVHAFLTCENTSLELINVHFATNVAGFNTQPSDALIHVHGGDLLVRGCSFSARGTPNTSMAALRVSDPEAGIKSTTITKPDAESGRRKILIAETVIRGDKLTAVLAESAKSELVVHQSLLLSGDAGSVRLGRVDEKSNDVRHRLVLSAATVVASRSAIEYAGNPTTDWQFKMSSVNSLLTAPTETSNGALLRVLGMDDEKLEKTLNKRMKWTSTSSFYPGWKWLVKQGNDGSYAATSLTQWKHLWDDEGATEQAFRRKGFPTGSFTNVCEMSLQGFDREALGSSGVEVVGGGNPGVTVTRLTTAGLSIIDAVLVIGRRPIAPEGMLVGSGVGNTVPIDLNREDLGKVLANKKFNSGTTVIASGHGVCTTSPIVIRDAWIRLHFRQTPGEPLVLMPRQLQNQGDSPEALINVTHGGVEIFGGAILSSGMGNKAPAPKWLISAEDSDVVISHSRLQGPMAAAPGKSKGLIQWRSSAAPSAPKRPFAADRLAYLAIADSFLLSSGTAIDADLRQRSLLMGRSVLLSRENLIVINLGEQETTAEGVVDISQSTLSTLDTYFTITPPEIGKVPGTQLQFFTDRTVFGPALKQSGRAKPSTLLSLPESVRARNQVKWWEMACGFAPDVGCLLRDPKDDSVIQDYNEVWSEQWQKENCLAPLLGPQGILLRDDLPSKPSELSDLEVTRFLLHPNSKGASWDGGASAIGAPVERMVVPSPNKALPISSDRNSKGGKKSNTNAGGF